MTTHSAFSEIRQLLGGSAEHLAEWTARKSYHGLYLCCITIFIGCGLYGATLGLWRAPLQGFYTAIKFPGVILLTCGGNALLNGCLAQLWNTGIGFRQSTLAILFSFAITALILAACAPLMLFLLWNTPPLSSNSTSGHSITLLVHVFTIAGAGTAGNVRLLKLLAYFTNKKKSLALLLTWLAGNLLLGAQLSWVLRPFIGSPHLPVDLLRNEPFRGNFFEAVWHSILRLTQ